MDKKYTIKVAAEVKEQLTKLKIHPREPYSDVIKRLLEKRCGEKPND